MYQEISAVAEPFRLADFCERFGTIQVYARDQVLRTWPILQEKFDFCRKIGYNYVRDMAAASDLRPPHF